MSKKNQAKYKPLLFTTTVRNPERIKYNLYILKKFEGKILSNKLAEDIIGELIRYGLYRPTRINDKIKKMWRLTANSEFASHTLSDSDVKKIIKDNPQMHKEAGFEKGYPSRFATIFDFAKQLGFIYFKTGEKIEFSELGNLLLETVSVEVTNGEINFSLQDQIKEQYVFMQAFARYQRCNPFVRVLNNNIPLVLLLNTIKNLNNDSTFGKSKGISRKEIPLLLFWKNNNSRELYLRIKKLRQKHGYNPSDETIIDICINEIMQGEYKKFDTKSIIADYTDEFIRKMRMTGLISIRGAGRFIDINHNEDEKIKYILNNYSNYILYEDEYDYFKYASKIDNQLISAKTIYETKEKTNALISEWLKIFDFKTIKEEMHNLATKRNSKDNILKLLAAPVRLEFLTTLIIKSKFPDITVIPNYAHDDTGLPTSTAGGNKGDIECFETDKGILVEVTMSEGRTQTIMEIWPIERHLQAFIQENNIESQCVFIAPTVYSDSKRQIDFVKYSSNLKIRDYKIDDFISYIETSEKLYKV